MTDHDIPSAEAYCRIVQQSIADVSEQRHGPVQRAADLIAASLQAGGVIQAFGTCHSQALAMEIAGRAGGLVPANRLALTDVVIYGGEPAELIRDGMLERDPTIAARVYALSAPEPQDVFVIGSSSGVNGSIVEMARIAKDRGHAVIAVTSLTHTAAVDSRHPSGQKLIDLADVVLDNGAPIGDAVLPLPGGGHVCAVSSITAALIAQMIAAEVVGRLIAAGQTPPVYLSANVPDGDTHNKALEDRYDGRIRRITR